MRSLFAAVLLATLGFIWSMTRFSGLLLFLGVTPAALGSVLYDQTITDGIRQARPGSPVVPPLTFETTFTNTPPRMRS